MKTWNRGHAIWKRYRTLLLCMTVLLVVFLARGVIRIRQERICLEHQERLHGNVMVRAHEYLRAGSDLSELFSSDRGLTLEQLLVPESRDSIPACPTGASYEWIPNRRMVVCTSGKYGHGPRGCGRMYWSDWIAYYGHMFLY